MIQIDHVQTYGWEAAIRGMRNPMNSWEKMDSYWRTDDRGPSSEFYIGPNDLALMRKLVQAGTDHSKFMRMIWISMDITAPLYWWKEFDTYKIGTTANSCSTMHKIHSKRFTLDDFSCEHLDEGSLNVLQTVVKSLEHWRVTYQQNGQDKYYWWQIIQLLPSSYNQLRTVTLNYQVARHIYHARRNHKLDEWHGLCEALEQLPCAKELIVP